MMFSLSHQDIRSKMEENRKWFVGDPRDRHTMDDGTQIFYEQISLVGQPEVLTKVVDLIVKDAGSKNLVWRTVPEIVEFGHGMEYRIYMRYAFTE